VWASYRDAKSIYFIERALAECLARSPLRGRRQPVLQSRDMQQAAFGVHLAELQAAGFGDPQAVAEHQQQQATVAGRRRSAGGHSLSASSHLEFVR
jgi:hypothetical protein